MSRTKLEIHRDALLCSTCYSDLDRVTLRCHRDPSHVDVELCDEGVIIAVDVEAYFSRVIPGRYSGPPERCYPDEGGDVLEFRSTVDGDDFYLTDAEYRRAVNLCWDAQQNDY